jgi:YegS/Rv2252/BmrU family lipid kinase
LHQKSKLIYNPFAGKGNAEKLLPKVQALLLERNFDYDLVLTEGPGHANTLAQQFAREGCKLLVVAGGDGTVNEVINGLMQSGTNGNGRPVMAVLPVGRGNDFSFGMDIPQDLQQACDVLVQGKRRCIDIGHVAGGDYPQGRYFGNGVGLGFDTVVGFEAAKIKWLHGAASYLVALIRTIFLYAHAPVFEVVTDNETIQQPFLMVSVMNGRRMGGSFHMAPEGDPGDGSFDLCLAGQVRQSRILPLALKFISGTQKEHPAVRMVRSQEVSIRAIEGGIPAHADGETICTAGKSLTIKIFPDALEVISQKTGEQL